MIGTLMHHKLLVILIAAILVVGVWFGLSQGGAPAAPALTTQNVAVASPAGQELVATLLTLRAVKLDGTIFSDPAFLALKDFSTQIVPEPVGRGNPFLPLSATAQNATTTRR